MHDGDWKVLATLNISTLRSVESRNAAQVKTARLSDFQMFKITEDIGERHDLSGSQPERLAEIENMVLENEIVDWIFNQVKVIEEESDFDSIMKAN